MVAGTVVALFHLVALASLSVGACSSCDTHATNSQCKGPRASDSMLLQAKSRSRTFETTVDGEEEACEDHEERLSGWNLDTCAAQMAAGNCGWIKACPKTCGHCQTTPTPTEKPTETPTYQPAEACEDHEEELSGWRLDTCVAQLEAGNCERITACPKTCGHCQTTPDLDAETPAEKPTETPTEKPTETPTEAPFVVKDGFRFLEDVSYGSDAKHFVDFILPNKVDPQDGWPVVVAFHGSNGDKSELHGFCKHVIEKSESTRACMPVNFREKRVVHKQKQEDASKAVWWLVNNAATYKIQKESIILYGYSLGGFLANSIIWNEPDFTSKYVSAAVFSAGVGKNIVANARAGHPPLLVISSEDDNVVKYEYSKAYFDKLKALGGIVHLLKYYTSGHFPGREPSFYEQIDAFLDGPSSYEAPDTINMTTTPAPSTCKNFCFRHSAEWSLRCTWSDCSACGECDLITTTTTTKPPACRHWCRSGKQAWSSKCNWNDCSLCRQCSQ